MSTALAIGIPALVIGVPLLLVLLIYVVMPACRGVGFLFGQVFRFIGAMFGDVLRLVGAVLTVVVLAFLVLGNIVVNRWSAAQHFGRAVQGEFAAAAGAIYRLCFGHWVRLFCLTPLVEGIEQRVPQVMQAAPGPTIAGGRVAHRAGSPLPPVAAGAKVSPARAGQFDGYEIVGTLAGGGSGGKLYIARPTPIKQAAFERQGFGAMGTVGDVVIKSFSVREGSSLPQIVRESRALEAAKKLGLVLEHELTPERFFYVMRYVPGDALGIVATRLHAHAGPGGLDAPGLAKVIAYATDLVSTLDQYHRAGLWHKDIKPDNIIVSTHDGRAHLVDFGLLTPLRSSLTLTTHGTEYFRDPEMVRLALKGVKVHEVDGARFDIYGAGAVIFSIVENSFPAHGGLSQITRRCPDALKWVVRRAMTEYDRRYPTSALMLEDLRALALAADPYAVKPGDLPSMRGADAPPAAAIPQAAAGPMYDGPPVAPAGPALPLPPLPAAFAAAAVAAAPNAAHPQRPRPVGVSAEEQVRRARSRAAERSERARMRFGRRSASNAPTAPVRMNAGVLAALGLFVLVGAAVVAGFAFTRVRVTPQVVVSEPPPAVEVMFTGAARSPEAATPQSARAQRAARRGAERFRVDGLRLMVMREPVAFDPAFEPAADAHVARLTGRGFIVIADEATGAAADKTPEAFKQATEAAAALRGAVGMRPLGGDEARSAVVGWLDSAPGSGEAPRPHVVIWFARHPADPARLMAWVVPASSIDQPTTAGIRSLLGAVHP